MTKSLLTVVLSIIVISCTKIRGGEDHLPYITFGVSGLETDTKALITEENFTNGSTKVYVYGWRNNTNNIFNKTQITKEQNSSNWNPPQANQRKWSPGSSYSFHAICQSPDTPGNGASLSVSNNGMTINISQPTAYSQSDMVDYMLSHSYKVADGSNHHIVMLYMEHAMAWIEVVVEKEMPEHNIVLNRIILGNIYRSASMQCEAHANANSGNTNGWTTQLSGNNDLSYTEDSFTPEGENILGKISFLAVPQQLTDKTTLSVTYTVTEYEGSVKEYTETFQLFNYTPYVWESGHKITYTLTINTGVQLKAHIADWMDGGYTEGVII